MLARRKEIYEAIHPETKEGAAQAIGMNAALGNNVERKLQSTSFVTATASEVAVRTALMRSVISPVVSDRLRKPLKNAMRKERPFTVAVALHNSPRSLDGRNAYVEKFGGFALGDRA